MTLKTSFCFTTWTLPNLAGLVCLAAALAGLQNATALGQQSSDTSQTSPRTETKKGTVKAKTPTTPTSNPTAANFVAYKITKNKLRFLASHSVPTPGFNVDAVVFIVDQGMTRVLAKARIIRAIFSPKLNSHNIEMIVLEPPSLVNKPSPIASGFVVTEEAIKGPLAHLKADPNINLISTVATGTAVSEPASATAVNHANPIVSLGYFSQQYTFAAIPLILGSGNTVTALGQGAELEISPPKIGDARWVNWIGLGFRYYRSFENEIETYNFLAKKNEKFKLTSNFLEPFVYFRPTFNDFLLPRISLEIVPWFSEQEKYQETVYNSVYTHQLTGQKVNLGIEFSLFSSLVTQFNGYIPLQSVSKLNNKNAKGEEKSYSGKQKLSMFSAMAGLRHQFPITGNKLSSELWGGADMQSKTIESELGKAASNLKVGPKLVARIGLVL